MFTGNMEKLEIISVQFADELRKRNTQSRSFKIQTPEIWRSRKRLEHKIEALKIEKESLEKE